MNLERSNAGLVPLSVALLTFAGPLYVFGRWVAVLATGRPHEEAVAAFMAGFPAWLPTPQAVTWASISACLITVAAAVLARRWLGDRPRQMASALLGVAALMAAWNLFTLM